MSEEERERCLEPFFTTKGERGTGLGLAVVYGIIQRHEGRIEIESAKGTGTSFSFWLPESVAIEAPIAPVVGKVDRSLRVLVVDDQEIICELIAEYLREDGHVPVTASNGMEALERYRESEFDLVITDQSMPELNGGQLARALKDQTPGLPIILLTGFGEEMQAQGQRPDGIDVVIGKPVSSTELRRVMFLAMNGELDHSETEPGTTDSQGADLLCTG
jgi:CheY-like chemotaxis protein